MIVHYRSRNEKYTKYMYKKVLNDEEEFQSFYII